MQPVGVEPGTFGAWSDNVRTTLLLETAKESNLYKYSTAQYRVVSVKGMPPTSQSIDNLTNLGPLAHWIYGWSLTSCPLLHTSDILAGKLVSQKHLNTVGKDDSYLGKP